MADDHAIQLDTISRTIQSWIDWSKKSRDKESLPTDDDTAIMSLPVGYWPSHGEFEAWIKELRDIGLTIDRLRRGNLSTFDYERLVAWMRDPQRMPASTAFTAGATRDAASAFEEAAGGQIAEIERLWAPLERATMFLNDLVANGHMNGNYILDSLVKTR